METDSTVELRIKNLLLDVLKLNKAPEEIASDESLIQGGLGLDSTLSLELLCSIEDEFGIEIPDEELGLELFENVAALADYVTGKMGAKCAAAPGSREEREESTI